MKSWTYDKVLRLTNKWAELHRFINWTKTENKQFSFLLLWVKMKVPFDWIRNIWETFIPKMHNRVWIKTDFPDWHINPFLFRMISLQIHVCGARSTWCAGWAGPSKSFRWSVWILRHFRKCEVVIWLLWAERDFWQRLRHTPVIFYGSTWKSFKKVRIAVWYRLACIFTWQILTHSCLYLLCRLQHWSSVE